MQSNRHPRRPAGSAVPSPPSGRRTSALGLAGSLLGSVVLAGALTAAPAAAQEAAPRVFTVTSTADAADAGRGRNGVCATSAGSCTLRAALMEANGAQGRVTIRFALPGALPATISPASRLPALTNAAGITLDGWSQPGSRRNTSALVDNGRIGVQIAGRGPDSFEGLSLPSSDNVVQGLAIYNFAKAINMDGAGADRNEILGNHLCTNAAGTFGSKGTNTAGLGVYLNRGASENVIGKPGSANRNVISGCFHRGVTMSFLPTTNNRVQNNIIGLNPTGTAALPNRSHGVDVNYTFGNVIGGDGPQEGNVLSGNQGAGVEISHSRNTHDNVVVGNVLGGAPGGTRAPAYAANKQWGVRLEGPFSCNLCTEAEIKEGIPFNNTVRGNVIVGNTLGGIHVDKGQHNNRILDNRIGLTADGTPGGNGVNGIRLEHAANNNLVQGNEIAYNPRGILSVPTGLAPGASAVPTNDNTFSRNSIHDNTGLGIDLAPLGRSNAGQVGDVRVNRGVKVPVLTRATANAVTGRACAGCTIEVFAADGAGLGEGRRFLAAGRASASGAFTIALPASAGGPVTATATLAGGSTSEFAATVTVPGG